MNGCDALGEDRRRAPFPRDGYPTAVWLALLVALVAGCSGHSRSVAPTSVPSGPLLVALAESQDTTQLQLFDPHSGQLVRTLASIKHRANWGVNASASPDGRQLAYVVLPPDALDPDTQGELWLLPLAGRSARRLATGVDLRSELVWSPDGSWVSYEKVNAPAIDLRRVNASGAGDQSLVTSSAADRWYLFGYAADGQSLELAHLTNAGTALVQTAPGATPSAETPIAPGAARDFSVAPDGRPALLVLETVGGKQAYRALARQADGSFARLTQGGAEDTGIAWNPRTGQAAVGVVPAAPGAAVPAASGAQTIVPPDGFDVPVAWSPDGALLALRHFSGSSTDQPGQESIVILSGAGRRELHSDTPLTIAGWTLFRS